MSNELAKEIAQTLNEKNTWQIRKVVNVIGADRAREFFQQTLDIEAEGGMLVVSGKRRRTAGGVFFYLVRKNVSTEERKAIFPRTGRKKKSGGKAQSQSETQPQVQPPTWGECQAYVRKLLAHPRGEVSTMKFTLIGRPKQVAKAKTCMVCVMEGKSAPQSMPKGLPTPPSTPMNFAVFIADKQWKKIADSLKENKDDELIVEGYPVFDPAKNVTAVLAQSVTTKLLQRKKREVQTEGA